MTVDQITREFMNSLSFEEKKKLARMTIEYEAGRITMDDLRDAYISARFGGEVRIEWNGNELLRQIEKNTAAACESVAHSVASDARRFCPVKTGALKQSIKVGKSKFAGYVVLAGGGDQYYGTFVELGAAGKPAHPFLRPALAKNKKKLRRLLSNRL